MQRKSFLFGLAVAAALVLLSSTSMAASILPSAPWASGAVQAGDNIKVFREVGTTNGGEFIVTKASNPTAGLFGTFCLERTVPIRLNTQYTVLSLDTQVFWGANGRAGTPLDPRTAYLYSQYYNGTLSNYVYDPNNRSGRQASANALQLAIWFLQREPGGSNQGQSGTWISQAANAIANGQWSGIGNVRALNLDYFIGKIEIPVQTLLTMIGGSSNNGGSTNGGSNNGGTTKGGSDVAPEPTTFAIWSLMGGMVGLALWLRRRKLATA